MQVMGLGCATRDGRVLLADVGFKAAAGEPLALLGPSGAGKSLALRCVLGLAPAGLRVSGCVLFKEEAVDLSRPSAMTSRRGRGVTLLPQAAAESLDPVRTVGRQLSEVLGVHDNREESPESLVALVGLSRGLLRAHPLALSGGQAQRVALALALACRPGVLLADEPTASLDNVAQAAMLAVIAEVCAARRVALVLVTHDLAVAARICVRAAVMDAGRIVEVGALARMIAAPEHATTRDLVAAARRVEEAWGG